MSQRALYWACEGSAVVSKISVIAVIDDDASVRATTDSLVRSLGYTVHTFASAEEFLRSNRLDDLSCVIADVQMPGMSGVELQAHLLSQGYRVPRTRHRDCARLPVHRCHRRCNSDSILQDATPGFQARSLSRPAATTDRRP